MAKKVFKSDLSVKGIEALKSQLLQYKDSLPIKCEKLVSRLLQSGVVASQAKISESPLGKYVTVTTNISADKMGCKGILLAKGEVKEQEGYAPFSILLAIEFGSGVHFNPTCPRSTYNMQIKAMTDYIAVLEARAVMEDVDLGE